MLEYATSHLAQFTIFDYIIFVVNLLVLIFARRIVSTVPSDRKNADIEMRLMALRAITILLFLLYFIGLLLPDLLQKVGKTAITLLIGYLVSHFLHVVLLHRFGRVREIDGEVILSESYQSEVFHLLAVSTVAITALVALINIWDLTSWLKTTSALGALLIIAFSTKDVWAPDNINGLILLYNDTIQSGSIVRCNELQILGVVVQISLTQTTIRDLRQRHLILIPNSKFRNSKLEILNSSPNKSLTQFIDFNLAYGLESAKVVEFFKAVWKEACVHQSAINPDVKCRVVVLNNGDHAVTWRVFFGVRHIYKTLSAEFAFNRAAYDLSLKWGIGLNTPVTHLLEQTQIPPTFDQAADEQTAST